MTVKYALTELLFQCDQYYPPTGTIRYVALMSAALVLAAPFTADATANVLTFTTAQPFQTGARIRVTSTGALPTPLVAGVDYFVSRLTATTFKLTVTIGATEIDLMDAGSGTLTANEQTLVETDPIAVLLSKETAAFSGYATRFPITDVGAAAIVLGKAQKTKLMVISNSGTVALSLGYYMIIRGGNATIGDTTIAGYGLEILANNLAVAVGETRGLNLVMRGS